MLARALPLIVLATLICPTVTALALPADDCHEGGAGVHNAAYSRRSCDERERHSTGVSAMHDVVPLWFIWYPVRVFAETDSARPTDSSTSEEWDEVRAGARVGESGVVLDWRRDDDAYWGERCRQSLTVKAWESVGFVDSACPAGGPPRSPPVPWTNPEALGVDGAALLAVQEAAYRVAGPFVDAAEAATQPAREHAARAQFAAVDAVLALENEVFAGPVGDAYRAGFWTAHDALMPATPLLP